MMLATAGTFEDTFVDRRGGEAPTRDGQRERRQFASNYDDLSLEGRELGRAIDQYKVMHRRRFITFDEMLAIIKSLGYERAEI
jgi:hypothetical protein